MGRELNWGDVLFVLGGVGMTIALWVVSGLIGIVAGLLTGIALTFPYSIGVRSFARIYVEVYRATPILLQLILLYYGAPLLGIDVPALVLALTALSLYAGANLGEIVRSGIESIHVRQWEAAASLGLTYIQDLRYVILPQCIRVIIPPTIGFLVDLNKVTALAYVIGIAEITRNAKIIVENVHYPLAIWGVVALLYFALCYPLSSYSRKLEARVIRKGSWVDGH